MLNSQPGSEELYNKVYGCLAGVAVGDAMGMPGSGYLPHEIKERFGYIDRLFELYKYLGIPKNKYSVKVWNIDQLDRFLNEEDDPNYNDKLTPEGMNWFYAKGLNLIKFPAIDINIKFTQSFLNEFETKISKKRKPNNFYRQQGIGKSEEGNFNFGGLIEGFIDFLKDFDEGKLNASVLKHKEKVLAQDPHLDKRFAQR